MRILEERLAILERAVVGGLFDEERAAFVNEYEAARRSVPPRVGPGRMIGKTAEGLRLSEVWCRARRQHTLAVARKAADLLGTTFNQALAIVEAYPELLR